MIEKIKRPQKFNKQEMQIPRNIQELMQRYDLDNMSSFDGKYSSLSGTPTIPTKTSELTNDSGYSTENWVTNEITKAVTGGSVDLSGYAEKNYVDNKLATKADTSHTHEEYLTEIPSEYITETELNNKAYLTEVPKEYITETELDEKGYLTEHQDISNKANKTDLDAHILKNDIHVTTADKANWDNKSNFSGNYNDLTNRPTIPAIPTDISAFKNDVGYLTEHQDISSKAEKTDLINHTSDGDIHVTLEDKRNWNNKSDFDGVYSSLTGKPTIPSNTSDLTNDCGFITSIPSEYVTETELNNKGYLTNVPNTYKTKAENDELYQEKGNYLTSYTETDPTVPSHVKAITTTNISNWNKKSDFSGNYNDLTGKPSIPSKTSELTNDSKFSTESWVSNEIAKAVTGGTVDLSGYAEKTYVDSQLETKADANHAHNEYLTEIPSEYITDTELNAKGYLTEHQDISSKADKTDLITHTSNNDIHITATDKANWNAKSDFSGNYNDLTNQPTIPTVPTDVSAFTNDAGYITSDSEKFNEYLPRSGGTMTKKIVFDNKSEYEAIQKTRTIDGVDYVAKVGVGNVNGGTVSFELASNGEVLGRLDVLADGSIRNGITGGILIDSTDSRVRQRCAMTVYLSSDQTIPANNAPFINLNTVETSLGLGSLLGSDLELSGNAILCKRAGVIEVSGSVGFSGLAVGGNVQIRTFKNKSTQITNLQTRVSNTGDQSFGTQTKIVAVEANTPINLYVGNWSSNAITAKAGSQLTFLSVRYID